MSESESQRSEWERQVDALITAYYEAVERGESPDASAFVAAHPEYAPELEEFLADVGRLDQAVNPEVRDPEATRVLQPSAASRLIPGTRLRYFGEYELLEELGIGGMGVVYKARQTRLKRIVALKLIKAGELADPQDLKRFEAEARAAACLTHPGIVPVHEVGVYRGQHFYTMDYVDGGSLARLHRDEPVASRRAAELILQLAEAMHYAHTHGIVHRDLKPANILLTADGMPRITDFGLAKLVRSEDDSDGITLTETGQILGTAGYMSPEQAAGKTRLVGPPADIYALGAVLYVLLTSRAPFVGDSLSHTILQVLHQEPVSPRILNPSVPRDLETICLKCLEKESHKRFGSARLLADDLERFLAGRPVHARPIGTMRRTARWCRRNPWVTTSLALLTVLALVTSMFATTFTRLAGERESALRRVQETLDSTTSQLYLTSVERAKATRLSGRPGQSRDTLDAVRTAAALINPLQLDPVNRQELRDQVIGALALVDLHKVSAWREEISPTADVVVSPNHDRIVHGMPAAGIVRVHHFPGDARHTPTTRPTIDVPTPVTPNNSFFRISLSGKWVASCDYSSLTVRFLDLERSVESGSASGVHGWRAVDFHPTQDVAIIGLTSGAIVRFDLSSQSSVPVSTGGQSILSVRCSADGRRFAVIRQSGLIEIRNFESSDVELTFSVPPGSRGVCWSPDGSFLAVEIGVNFRLFDLRAKPRPAPSAICHGHRETIIEMQWHPHLPLVASTSHDGTTSLWDAVSGRRLVTVVGLFKGFRCDGSMMAVRLPHAVEFWRIIAPELLRWLDQRWTRSISVHPTVSLLATGHWNGASLFDLANSRFLCELPIGPTAAVAFDPANGDLLTSGPAGLYRWLVSVTAAEGRQQVQFGPPNRMTRGPASDGTLRWGGNGHVILAAGSGRQNAQLLDRDGALLAASLLPTAGMARMDISADGRWAAGGDQYGESVSVFDLKTGLLQRQLPVAGGLPYVRFSPDGTSLAVNGIGAAMIWSVGDWKLIHRIPTSGSNVPAALAFSPDGTMLALGSWGTGLQLFDVSTGNLVANLNASNTPLLFRELAFTPDGERLVCAADREGTCVWNFEAMRYRLRELDLDWGPPRPARPTTQNPPTPLCIDVDLGELKSSGVR